MTRTRRVLPFAASLFALGLVACEQVPDSGPASAPAAEFWDAQWTFLGTSVEDGASVRLPLPTDFEFIERLGYGEDGGPPVKDVLEGAVARFELDGHLLVQPAGAEALEYLSTDYRVLDDAFLELSVHKSIWFSERYSFDETSDTLLIESESEAGPSVMPFVLDVAERTLFSGDLESAAGRVDALLFEDPRNAPAMDAFLFDVLHGQVASIPIQDSAAATAWIIGVLRQTGVVAPDTADDTLEGAIAPIVADLSLLGPNGLSRELLDRLLASGVITDVISEERANRVLRFALYRRVLEATELANVGRVDLLFGRVD